MRTEFRWRWHTSDAGNQAAAAFQMTGDEFQPDIPRGQRLVGSPSLCVCGTLPAPANLADFPARELAWEADTWPCSAAQSTTRQLEP